MKVVGVFLCSVLALGTAATAKRSGGRAGGGSFSRRSTTRKASARSAPTQQQAAPMPVYGYAPMGGGMGMGTTTALMGLSLLDAIVEEQRRAAIMRQQLEMQKELGKNQGEMAALKAQLEAQERKIADMQAQAASEKK